MWVRLRRYFLSGLVIFLPLSLTSYLLIITINYADGLFGNLMRPYFIKEFGLYPRGISIPICIVVITLMGFFATNFLGKKIHSTFENLILKLPFFRQVYPAIKEIARFLFLREEKASFKQVVWVQYPRMGIYSLGFLTNESGPLISKEIGEDLCNVFLPNCPTPITGYVIFIPRKDLIFSDLTVEEAIKMVVSVGVVIPLRTVGR